MPQYSGVFTLSQVAQAIRERNWTNLPPEIVEYLVVGGGGGGGFTHGGGGGGAGGLISGFSGVTAGSVITVTVGGGGATSSSRLIRGSNGSNSGFGSFTAFGGGGGGSYDSTVANGGAGGSGGGGSAGNGANGRGGAGSSGQGFAGGSSVGSNVPGGGGGGAGAVGGDQNGVFAGFGGNGVASDISGTRSVYAGGGGSGVGFSSSNTAGQGGAGGGGSGFQNIETPAISGAAHTGGGGGGGGYTDAGFEAPGGVGGSGIVIIRYPGTVQHFTGGTLSYANGYIIHTFYSSGTLAPTASLLYVNPDYQISRSLRFNSADSAYLNRTPASAGNRKTWTWSGWVKRSSTGGSMLLSAGDGTEANRTDINFTGANQIALVNVVANSANVLKISTQVFRDFSAWYHIVVAFDSTTAPPTQKMYVNGVEITVFSTNTNTIAQNGDSFFNSTSLHNISRASYGTVTSNDYMTEVNFIDGQALTPASFGYYNFETGVWSPTKYVGAYGTNGFYLNFSNNSNTTAATLGADYSGNGNNWTPNNFSVSAGAGNDSLVDSPTAFGTDTGVGGEVRGNYSTMNPLDTGALDSTLSDGNLKVVTEIGNFRYMGNTIWTSAGKFYAEFKITADSGFAQIGIAVRTTTTNKILGVDSDSWSYNGWNGSSGNNNSFPAYGSAFGTGDTIGIAVDRDTNKLYFSKNGVWQNSGDPAAGTGSLNISGISGIPAMIAVCDNDNAGSCTFEVNFGQRPFAYAAPSGFKALNTQNLPTPTIGATTATQAGKFFNPVIYSGDGTNNRTISGVGFQPDFVWLKTRNIGFSHLLYDVIRGVSNGSVSKALSSNSTAAEGGTNDDASFGYLSGFATDGFSVVKGTQTNAYTNSRGDTYVAWNWRANGAGVSNTAGSITSTVSANTTSGFSIVTYTGNSTSGATVGHGLGVAPAMMIVKKRNVTLSDWPVYHASLGATGAIRLNLTSATDVTAAYWNNTAPTSSVFSIGNASDTNQTSAGYVAYCFSEVPGYSKFGSYTGNGSADGAFVYTGFRPSFIMLKNASNARGGDSIWWMHDDERRNFNPQGPMLGANSSNAEVTFVQFDMLSNGFKLRTNSNAYNLGGDTYIFMAFAETPQKFALAR
jgi:hypothetical protein